MTREEIEKSKKGNLFDFSGNKNLLVSFGGIQQGIGIPVFEFFNSIKEIPCDKIFLRDFHQAWYQKGVDDDLNHINKVVENLQQVIDKNKYENICFLGNSMEGYAAILFGTLLNVDTVISFAPQTFIGKLKRKIHKDTRWNRQIKEIYKFKDKEKSYFDLKKHLKSTAPYKTSINIYYSPSEKLDQIHAERLKSGQNIKLHSIAEGGHSVVVTVKKKGELKSLIERTFLKN